MKAILLAGLGSMCGGMLRYAVSLAGQGRTWLGFPTATVMVNLFGCLLMGLLLAFSAKNPAMKSWMPLLGAGLLGGFTTFSAFSAEAMILFQNGKFSALAFYVLLSVVGGLALTWLAYSAVTKGG